MLDHHVRDKASFVANSNSEIALTYCVDSCDYIINNRLFLPQNASNAIDVMLTNVST